MQSQLNLANKLKNAWHPSNKTSNLPFPSYFVMPCPQSRRYVFTVDNCPNAVGSLDRFQNEHCMYLIYRRDKLSLHGFFTLKRKLSVTSVLKTLPVWMKFQLEPAKGTSKDLVEYYSKYGGYVEFGEPPYPGKRGGKKHRMRTQKEHTTEFFRQFATVGDMNSYFKSYPIFECSTYATKKRNLMPTASITINK